MRAKQLACAAGVLGAGVVLAWPFRQDAPPALPPPAAPIDLALRRPDVALAAGPPGESSPAVGLDVIDGAGNLVHVQTAAYSSTRPSLEDLGPPPEMPIDFAPVAVSPPSTAYVPRSLAPPSLAQKPMRPRQYTLRDGDTLEDLAKRMLGSESRAREIFEANRAVLPSPDLLPIGVTIVIPPRVQQADELTSE
ncbi:MAG TPA: hypothetical protein VFV87_06790 [Pirellulaceae bacterium]|nr:hypothetical protein [Pirellulaceae bacterium]